MVKPRNMRWIGHVARMGRGRRRKKNRRKVYKLAVGKREGNRPLERRRRRSVDNIKKNFGD
jgi:hypothetical protein